MIRTLSILLITLILSGVCFQAIAKKEKNPCRSVKESKDPFSNELTKVARLGISGGSGYWTFTLKKKGEVYFLTVDIQTPSLIEKKLLEGDTIYIKLQNEKTILLPLETDCRPSYQAGGGVATTWSVRTMVELTIMEQLSRSLIFAAKVKLDDRELTLTTKPDAPRAMEAIMAAARCISGKPVE